MKTGVRHEAIAVEVSSSRAFWMARARQPAGAGSVPPAPAPAGLDQGPAA